MKTNLFNKKNSLSLGLLGLFGLAAWVGLQSFQKNSESSILIQKEALTPIYKWYELVPTSSASASSQTLFDDQPMLTPPLSTGSTICAQDNNTGDFCAVLVEFAPGTIDFTLSTATNLAAAITANSDAVGIATGDNTLDPNEDGYSRHPQQ